MERPQSASMHRQLRSAIILLGVMILFTGVIYPVLVTLIAQFVFPNQANGSLIEGEGKYFGSELIGQQFDREDYFWGRPSSTLPSPYNGSASSASNYGPSNEELLSNIKKRIEALQRSDPGNSMAIPGDLVTSSASGLDPHISQAAAFYQIPRVARARHIGEGILREMVDRYTEGRQLGVLGEPRVNVLRLNLALDEIK